MKALENIGKRVDRQIQTTDPLFWEVWLMVFFLAAIMLMVFQSMTLGQ